MQTDDHYMLLAIRLAKRGLGTTAPNPSVGCVIVQDGRIISQGTTQPSGRPHAEAVALANAARDGVNVVGATAYVSLEPCAHHGETPPCAEALINAGIAHVVYASADPDARVSGKGAAMLEAAGVTVTSGICAQEANALYAGFFRRIAHKLPSVSLKVATSLDGHIANAQGESQWITGGAARNFGHMLRAQHDAILTGIGTALADNPSLTCRIHGLETRSPVRVILDRNLRLPADSALAKSAKSTPVWLCCMREHINSPAAYALREMGVEIIAHDDPDMPLKSVLATLAERGITSVMIEAGSTLNAHAINSNLVDKIYWFRAPMLIGSGLPAFSINGNCALDEAPRFLQANTRKMGDDLLEIYEKIEG